jgi:hypothetical protein
MLLLLSVVISITGSNASHYYASIFTAIFGVLMVEKLLANQALHARVYLYRAARVGR